MRLPMIVGALAAAVGIAAGVGVVASRPDENESTGARGYDAAYAALCRSATAATDGDLAGAQGLFISRAHGPLHDIAAALTDLDRSSAADLLEAKAAVEATLPVADDGAAAALRSLVAEARTAIAATTGATPPPCEGIDP